MRERAGRPQCQLSTKRLSPRDARRGARFAAISWRSRRTARGAVVKCTPESVKRRLDVVDRELAGADPLTRLHLLQEREDLSAELARNDASDDLVDAEKAFVRVAGAYGRRKGIGYSAWRAVGVSVSVLEKAGISRADKS